MEPTALYKKLEQAKGSLSHLAVSPANARRRFHREFDVDEFLGPACDQYILDLYKLHQSKAMRRLTAKTQVFPDPKNNRHIRTRLIHTQEVASIAGVIAQILGLNTPLTQAIAFGHDIGHAPFGHIGEEFIAHKTGKKFRHEIFACIIAQHIEREGRGLNLTLHTLEGIASHSRGKNEMSATAITAEADVVMFADKIAYCFSDVSDIFTRGYLDIHDYPQIRELSDWFGVFQRIRTGRCISALCVESMEKGCISFSDSEEAKRFAELRSAMYLAYPKLNRHLILPPTLEQVFELVSKIEDVDPAILLALMTDHEVMLLSQTESRDVKSVIQTFSVSEIIPFIRKRQIDFTDPDLVW
jgi:dGTP triphosphohydrolase